MICDSSFRDLTVGLGVGAVRLRACHRDCAAVLATSIRSLVRVTRRSAPEDYRSRHFSGIMEELLFRGILFRWIEEFGGQLVRACVDVGAVRLRPFVQPQCDLVLVLRDRGRSRGAARRRLYAHPQPVASDRASRGVEFHPGFIFGRAGVGDRLNGLVRPQLSGSEWLSGGPFGLEASVIALVLATAAGVWMMWQSVRRGGSSADGGSGAVSPALFRRPSRPSARTLFSWRRPSLRAVPASRVEIRRPHGLRLRDTSPRAACASPAFSPIRP